MAHQSDLISEDILEYLKSQENKSLLRFITCGSVDDGKSTLIGRLLYDSKLIFEDQLSSLESDSKKVGTQGGDMDFALLVDGLAAEREQGITIDVAYRFFSTDKRKFIVADTPGHEQYTRNMATGASNADLAIILIDARKGILTQTRRHSYIVSLLGIKHVLLAVNKMDLMDYDQKVFEEIETDYRAFAKDIGLTDITCVPISALKGDNILERGDNLDWYDGPTLMEVLETVDVTTDEKSAPFRFPVQWVNRPDLDFRGFSGTIVSGTVRQGDEIVVLPSAKTSRIKCIVAMGGDLDEAIAGQAVTLVLEDEIDISRGDVICRKENRAELTDQFMAHVLWMDEEHLLPGRPYLVKIGSKMVPGMITDLKYKVNVNSLEHEAGKALELNEVGVCNLSLSDQIPYDHYADIRETGAFIIINRLNNNTVGVGMIDHGLRRAENIHWQALDVDKTSRAGQKSQKPAVLWFTGYSGSGKSTVANALEKKLFGRGNHTYVLDGDNVRHGLNKDLGFTDVDRVENIRRVAETSKLMVDAGLITLVSFISPFRSERRMARELMDDGEFIEIFVNTPLEVCEQRDPKGLYKKARAGEIKNFTGFDSPYEEPDDAELNIDTTDLQPDQAADRIIDYLEEKGYLAS
ncbi:sulfate adenylyltransferase subunit CysN [Emcibacter nanhaiensis]|uniref:Multifunctional fusion protein n=1 Tax=Emcibacter nanhaiensis TaxID=1505037 RepID=A0A501PMS3_9PROT|nr:sulfate adenylyltransferase subunit CysN [Emcibacter nanhaiensis]TPD61749.1 sulfate adenylyltransferase subunit CysN [Emcibacter nanhaiensis]